MHHIGLFSRLLKMALGAHGICDGPPVANVSSQAGFRLLTGPRRPNGEATEICRFGVDSRVSVNALSCSPVIVSILSVVLALRV